MKPLLKKSSLALRVLLLLSVMHAGVARAEIMTAAIEAFVSGIDGYYLPSNLKLGDRVSFVYVFDDAETKAHHYYLDGRVQAIPMAAYPDLTALSDAQSAFSQNLLDTLPNSKATPAISRLTAIGCGQSKVMACGFSATVFHPASLFISDIRRAGA